MKKDTKQMQHMIRINDDVYQLINKEGRFDESRADVLSRLLIKDKEGSHDERRTKVKDSKKNAE